jgi:cell division protein ZipA
MESEIRIVLLIIGACIICAILWDGLRRQKKQRKSVMKRMDVDLKDEFEEAENDDRMTEDQAIQEPYVDNVIDPIANEFTEEKAQAYDEAAEREPTHAEAEDEAVENLLREPSEPENVKEEPEPEQEQESQPEPQETAAEQIKTEEAPVKAKESKTVMLTLIAPEDKTFGGFSLLQVLLAHGFRFGDMRIFHYHENKEESGKSLFSLAAATQTGEFDLSNMARFSCKGLVMFMTTSDHDDPVVVFDEMVEVAQDLAEDLSGELKIAQDKEWSEASIKELRDSL